MFTVRIIYLLDTADDYTFYDVNEAREFYNLKKNEYKDNALVSVSTDAY